MSEVDRIAFAILITAGFFSITNPFMMKWCKLNKRDLKIGMIFQVIAMILTIAISIWFVFFNNETISTL